MASSRYEVYNVNISRLPIDINGGLAFFGDPCSLLQFCDFSVQLREKVLKGVVLKQLHHCDLRELQIGVQNVFQITQTLNRGRVSQLSRWKYN
ncbi:unnamed protein product [Colias eurytheme]|nr:unnamed protein product [Colias eurytheme]